MIVAFRPARISPPCIHTYCGVPFVTKRVQNKLAVMEKLGDINVRVEGMFKIRSF